MQTIQTIQTPTCPANEPVRTQLTSSRRQAPGCQGQGRKEGSTKGHPVPLCPKGPNFRYLPPTHYSPTTPNSSIPPKVHPSSPPNGPVPNHPAPTQHRVCHEEDRGPQHFGIHCRPKGQQETHQGCRQEALRRRGCQDQHLDPVRLYFPRTIVHRLTI